MSGPDDSSTGADRKSERLRVAVVDDSTFIRKAITRMLEDAPMLRVVGSASSGEELLTHLDSWSPDVVTLDLDMPGMGGLATLDRLRALRPTPVIILSTHSGKGAPLTIEALHRGATDFIDKQRYSLVDFGALRNVLVEKILLVTGREQTDPLAEIDLESLASHPSVLDREATRGAWEPSQGGETGESTRAAESRRSASSAGAPASTPSSPYELVVMGASTGGPPTIQTILETIGGGFPLPIVIVQHMPRGFTQAFAERLNVHLPLEVREPHDGEPLRPESVYIATAGSHLRVERRGDDLVAKISTYPQELIHMPSVDVLFDSAARAVGARTIGVLLTGMGADGAKGMAALRATGAFTTCQDEDSCIVFGMPRSALMLGAVRETATPLEIGRRLRSLVGNSR